MEYKGYEGNELFSLIEPICSGLKVKIVHLSSTVVKSVLHISLVLYKKGGISIETCTEVSRTVLPRIEVWADNRDVSLEVSSPGVGRVLKNAYEFGSFLGEAVNLLLDGVWIHGIILYADKNFVRIKDSDGIESEYNFDSIQKAKLN